MSNLFKEYGKMVIAILVAVAFLGILIYVVNFKERLSEPAKVDTNIEHQVNEQTLGIVTRKSLPALKVNGTDKEIGRDELFKPLERVTGICYLTDDIGMFEYQKDENGNYIYETDDYGNPIFDSSGALQRARVEDTDNTATVSVAEIYFQANGSGEFVLLDDIPNKDAFFVNPEHYEHFVGDGGTKCPCGAEVNQMESGTIENEEYYNKEGILRVKYRVTDNNNAEEFYSINFYVDGTLLKNEEGAQIGGRER